MSLVWNAMKLPQRLDPVASCHDTPSKGMGERVVLPLRQLVL